LASQGFTDSEANDRGMVDVVGFETTAAAVIADLFAISSRRFKDALRQTILTEAKASVRNFKTNFNFKGQKARQMIAQGKQRHASAALG
jgi:hypothetical protein